MTDAVATAKQAAGLDKARVIVYHVPASTGNLLRSC